MNENQGSRLEFGLKLLSPLLAVGAFFWGIYTYRDASQRQLAQAKAEALKPPKPDESKQPAPISTSN